MERPFTVPTSSIHIHESIKPYKIIRTVQAQDDSNPDRYGIRCIKFNDFLREMRITL
ncbi:hypothetical protein TREAZ_1054 [Leadbettera azotonutricia ZAS-9]|uniref:Uncharacterized protein n=1 Tax=Leadbettera azotonutricia (strain ATCC BAA-888 / DSM 13862 / ZAS-9) TaxID=545695 RepID=F5Y7M4_LEAAZ|nr:hypothetical protein TREAZ_1054 [Leadbettera azotonutricia ZAS-9]